jgi:gliding motility-associated lipoprotein GldH
MRRRSRLFFFLSVLGLASSCNSDRIFEEYHGMAALHWGLGDTVSFEVKTMRHDVTQPLIGIRYNDSYPFHNLYVRYLLKDTLGNTLMDSLLNIHLFDAKSGKPLGNGFGNVYTKYDSLPRVELSADMPVRARFVQYMREDELQGIEAVGLKINSK